MYHVNLLKKYNRRTTGNCANVTDELPVLADEWSKRPLYAAQAIVVCRDSDVPHLSEETPELICPLNSDGKKSSVSPELNDTKI